MLLHAMKRNLTRNKWGHMALTAWTGVASAPFRSPTRCSLLGIDFPVSSFLADGVLYVDDLLLPVFGNACNPLEIFTYLSTVASLVVDTFAEHGFSVNLAAGKTESLLHFAGAGIAV